MILFPDDVIGATGFLVGSFSGVTMTGLQPAAILIAIGLVLALVCGYDLNVLALGEEIASIPPDGKMISSIDAWRETLVLSQCE